MTPAAAVGSEKLVVFSRSGIWTPLAAGSSFQFNVSSRSVSVERANEKVSVLTTLSLTRRSPLFQNSGAASEPQETP